MYACGCWAQTPFDFPCVRRMTTSIHNLFLISFWACPSPHAISNLLLLFSSIFIAFPHSLLFPSSKLNLIPAFPEATMQTLMSKQVSPPLPRLPFPLSPLLSTFCQTNSAFPLFKKFLLPPTPVSSQAHSPCKPYVIQLFTNYN